MESEGRRVHSGSKPFPDGRASRLSKAMFAASVALAGLAMAANANTAGSQDAAEEQPGVRNEVAGHVPDQAEQVARSPITPSSSPSSREWWSPGDALNVPEWAEYENEHGRLGMLNADGAFSTAGHAFFEPVGANGRACIS